MPLGHDSPPGSPAARSATTVRVLVIDDSALMRKVITEILSEPSDIEVVGSAPDPYVAREKIKRLKPDVLTLDVEMPRMDGVTFLRNLMRLHPLPVVMVSSLTKQGADVTLDALGVGAVDFVTKPAIDAGYALHDLGDELISKIRMAAKVPVSRLQRASAPAAPGAEASRPAPPVSSKRHFATTDQIIAVGASTGGTEAIREMLAPMPASSPGIVVVQHIPATFSGPFATRLNTHTAMTVREARDGEQIIPGHVYIAPGNQHLQVGRDGARYICMLSESDPVNRHRPSVDVMMHSVARNVGQNAIGVMLTGMGQDGAAGMLAMRQAGAPTFAQDERSSVVWGMPGAAVKLGAVEETLSLERIAPALIKRFGG